MAHITLIARINDGSGKFPFVKVEFSKNHRPIAIEGGTYYLRPSSGNRAPVHVSKDIDVAYAALLNSESGKIVVPGIQAERSAETTARKTVRHAADEYIEQSRGLGRKTYLGYRAAANLFLKYAVYTKAEFASLLSVTNLPEEALLRFLTERLRLHRCGSPLPSKARKPRPCKQRRAPARTS